MWLGGAGAVEAKTKAVGVVGRATVRVVVGRGRRRWWGTEEVWPKVGVVVGVGGVKREGGCLVFGVVFVWCWCGWGVAGKKVVGGWRGGGGREEGGGGGRR